ncbi:MAG: helix-turn-helix domain-containing protein [Deltaproteobacteria bacterium]|nr:helix-turn-helix domain-containing protein [Deltaproteobacteria bacterium]
MESLLVTVAQAARQLGVGTATVKRWCDAGLLRASRTAGGHRRFAAADVERLRAAQAGVPSGRSAERPAHERFLGDVLAARHAGEAAGHLLALRGRTGAWTAAVGVVEQAWDLALRRRESGHLTGLEERLATERILRATQLLTEQLPFDDRTPPWLFTCAEGEPARVPLALAELLLRDGGAPTLWAGGPTPVPSVIRALRALRPAALVVLATRAHRRPESLRQQAAALRSALRVHRVPLWLLGDAAWPDGEGAARALHAVDVMPAAAAPSTRRAASPSTARRGTRPA